MGARYTGWPARVTLMAVALSGFPGPGAAQTRVDLRTQTKGADVVGHVNETGSPHTAAGVTAGAKQGNAAKFQMFGGAQTFTGSIAVYDRMGNLLGADCGISSGELWCADNLHLSTLELPEMAANGTQAFVLHGAAAQAADGCIVLSGQPSAGQMLAATEATIVDDEGRTCAVMQWISGAIITSLDQIAVRDYASLQNLPTSFAPAPHAGSHRSGGSDEVASAGAAPNAIPKANSSGTLDPGWLPNPGAVSKGGVQAKDCAAAGAVAAINTDGTVTCGTAAIGQVNGVAYPANPAVNTVPLVTGANQATYTPIPQCLDSGGQHLNYDPEAHAFACGSSAVPGPPVSFWASANTADTGYSWSIAANTLYGMPIFVATPVSFTNLLFHVRAADATACSGNAHCYGVGIYDAAGHLKAHTGQLSLTSTGLQNAAVVEGATTLGPGWYLFAFNGTANAATLGLSSSANYLTPSQWYLCNLGPTTNAALPASVTAPAATAWSENHALYAGLYN